MTGEQARRWLAALAAAAGILMIAAAAGFTLLAGFTFHKTLVGLLGLLLVAAARLRGRMVPLYRDAALVVLNTLVLVIVLEAAATVVFWLVVRADAVREQRSESFYRDPEGWDQRDVAHAVSGSYVPYVIWKSRPHEDRYVHVDAAGHRVTPGARCGAGSYTVFMFGGSTTWGFGVPDWATLPAYVQARLDALREGPVCVRNLGQPGWVSTQGVIELLRRLQAGDVPDLVVFYDGINDIDMAASEGVAGGHANISRIRSRLRPDFASRRALAQLVAETKTFKLVERFVPSLAGLRSWPSDYAKPSFDADAMGAAIAEAYLTNVRAVEALAGAFGFEYAFFWQPNMFREVKPLTPEEQRLLEIARVMEAQTGNAGPVAEVVYRRVRAASADRARLFYIADVFRGVRERVYVDATHHLTPGGNERVAARIVETIAPH